MLPAPSAHLQHHKRNYHHVYVGLYLIYMYSYVHMYMYMYARMGSGEVKNFEVFFGLNWANFKVNYLRNGSTKKREIFRGWRSRCVDYVVSRGRPQSKKFFFEVQNTKIYFLKNGGVTCEESRVSHEVWKIGRAHV